MNKTELKNFAVSARRDLLEKVALRAKTFGIDEKNGLTIEEKFGQLAINGETYSTDNKSAFLSLKKQLEIKGYEQLIEEVAYTWFNRIIALRYMEVNEYLPERVNVLSSSMGKIEPDILSEFETMDLDIDAAKIKDLVRQGETEDAYRKLFIAQCNALNKILPFMFEEIHDYTELLLPDFLLDSESVVSKLVRNVSTYNFHNEMDGKDNVEVLGWLYQYYMSEKKEEVGGLKNTAVKKTDLPVVTQLFTPKWIVQYMVQNSLGKLYDERYPNNSLATNWEYYLKANDSEKLLPKFTVIEEIKVIDPACGSGHILLYAFDMLYDMYEEAGYPSGEIPKLILEKNIYGLDIDKRAQQIAYFALVMKAVEKQPRFLRKKSDIRLNVFEIVDTDYTLSKEAINLISRNDKEISRIKEVQKEFENGKQFGSLISPIDRGYKELIDRINNIKPTDLVERIYLEEIKEKLLPILQQASLLCDKYEVVITNPPYHNKYNDELRRFLINNYNEYKTDLYTAFIYKSILMTKVNGYAALMTPFTWMFIVTHENLRNHVISNYSISSLVQLEYSAFKEATVPICTFTIQNQSTHTIGQYIRLTQFIGEEAQPVKVQEAVLRPSVEYRYSFDLSEFKGMPSLQLAYWSTDKVRRIFGKNHTIGDVADVKQGLATADDKRFLRKWYEVDKNKIGLGIKSRVEAQESMKKWYPFNKGGNFRKWYGNNLYIVNWENDGTEIRNFRDEKGKLKSRPQNLKYYFKNGISWGLVSSSKASFRLSKEGYIPGHKGSVIYFHDSTYENYCFAILNSKVAFSLFEMIAPNIGFEVGNIKSIPIIKKEDSNDNDIQKINKLVKENIEISKSDWDAYENSWEYKMDPLLIHKGNNHTLSEAFSRWSVYTTAQFNAMKNNEGELNELLIDLYGLQDELTSEVIKDDINIRRAERVNSTKSFLSYFIGCILGRYSLDVEGLAFAGGRWEGSKYKTFPPNSFGLIQFTDEWYFENDIIARLREFLSLTFGEETVMKNVQWLAESLELKPNESAEERIRRYFMDEFFKDHCQVYQKSPIYWLVDSGKQKGLRTLIYMHRYQPDTMATIRFEHLQEIQAKYNNEVAAIDLRIVNPNLSATEKRELEKRKTNFQKRLEELLEFDKKLAEYANAQVEIDLDDGVKVNYAKFDKVLAKIK